mgnify:CR=1 FL=1
MRSNLLRTKLKPHLWFQLYWVVYLIWFFWLDLTIKNPKYIIHAPLDDLIPFCEWFVFPYCSWFFLLAGVTALLWWFDTASYDKLCLMMFSGMTFCLILYMVLPNARHPPHGGRSGPQQHRHDPDAAHLESRRLGKRLPLHPLPELGLHGHRLLGQHTGERPPVAQSAGLRLGGAHLRVHRLYQAALHHRCLLRAGRGIHLVPVLYLHPRKR